MSETRRTFLKLVGGGALAVDPIMQAFGRTQQGTKPSESATAETTRGKVRGASVDGVSIFRAVPYGGPTEGANRFLPPAKHAKWTGVRDATQKGLRCYQGGTDQNLFMDPAIGSYFSGGRPNPAELTLEAQSENCLVLNVLSPGLRQKLPVMRPRISCSLDSNSLLYRSLAHRSKRIVPGLLTSSRSCGKRRH